MLIEQGLDQVQLVRNAMKRELSLTVSGSFNPLHAQNELLRCEEYKKYLRGNLVNLKERACLLEMSPSSHLCTLSIFPSCFHRRHEIKLHV